MIKIFLLILLLSLFGSSCNRETVPELKVGMVTDGNKIQDNSFLQNAWQGILLAEERYNIKARYLIPEQAGHDQFLQSISDLYEDDHKLIIAPRFHLEKAVFQAQQRFPDADFILIDGIPHAGDYVPAIAANTLSILFAEHEAGFLAGLAAALELQTARFGFIGGAPLPAVRNYKAGFRQGLIYANNNFKTSVELNPEHSVYLNSFSDPEAGQKAAYDLFNQGVSAIFCVASHSGSGAIKEAKNRARNNEKVWIIGADIDQYQEGLFEEQRSVILTSAIKRQDQAILSAISQKVAGTFPGGQVITFNSRSNGVGIPEENPNLGEATIQNYLGVLEKLKSGAITVVQE